MKFDLWDFTNYINLLLVLLFFGALFLYGRSLEPELALEHSFGGFYKDPLNVTDGAWSTFLEYLPILGVAVVLKAVGKILLLPSDASGPTVLLYDAAFGLIVWSVLFGAQMVFPVSWVCVNYLLGRWERTVVLSWLFNGTAFYAMDYMSLPPSFPLYAGLAHWNLVGYFFALRCISFACDIKDSARRGKDIRFHRTQEEVPPVQQVTFVAFVAYAFYPPLFIGGPILRFSSFVQQRYQRKHVPEGEVAWYLLMWVFKFILFESLRHVIHPSAIVIYATNSVGAPSFKPPSVLAAGGLMYYMLKFTWFKFMLIWRFMRGWSLIDGINPPEDVRRCMSNNYTIKGFWKNFHASYNEWLVAYIYVPLGGSKRNSALNVVLVFSWVLFTHDRHLSHLDKYPWWFCIFVSAYVLENFLMQSSKTRVLKCVQGAVMIQVLFLGNLLSYGFESGSAGMRFLLSVPLSLSGCMQYIFIICFAFFGIGVHRIITYEDGQRALKQMGSRQDLRGHFVTECPFASLIKTLAAHRLRSTVLLCFSVLGPFIIGTICLDATVWSKQIYKTNATEFAYEACEVLNFNAFVRARLNAWSSFFFLGPAAYITYHLPSFVIERGGGGCNTDAFKIFVYFSVKSALISIFESVVSMLYHSGITHDTNWWDICGIYTIGVQSTMPMIYICVGEHLKMSNDKTQRFSREQFGKLIIILDLLLLVMVLADLLHWAFETLIPAWAVIHMCITLVTFMTSTDYKRRSDLLKGSAIMLIGGVLKFVDDKKILCNPHSFFQFTAIFHMLEGTGFLMMARFQYWRLHDQLQQAEAE